MTQRAILVLGMHRSGTSVLTGLLVRLGAQAPATPMLANEHNPLGFWESRPLYEFHERLLLAGGSRWDQWTRFDPSRINDASVGNGDELRALLRQEFGAAPLFVVKDPRICRFTSWWLRQLDADAIDSAAILALRSPLEVAHSLAARDGIGLEHALLLWLRHVLDAEFDTRAVRRSIIWYSDLILHWESVASRIATDLGLVWPPKPDTLAAETASFIRPALRHHRIDIGQLDVSPPLSEWVRQADAALALLTGAADRHSEARGVLDIVRRDFDQASSIFDSASSGDRRAQHERVNSLTAEGEELRRRAESAEVARDHLVHHASTVEAELERERQEASRLAAEREALAIQMEAERARLTHHASTVEAELERQRQETSRLATERDALAVQMAVERDRLTRRASTIEVELDRQRHESSRLAGERQELATQMDAERDGFSRHVAAVDADLEHLRREASHLTAERDAITQERDELRLVLVQTRRDFGSEIASLSGRLAMSDGRLQQMQQSRSWRWTAFLRAMMRPWLSARPRAPR